MAVYVFGGNVVQPAQLQYKAYTDISSNVDLSWPYEFKNVINVVAVQMNVSTTTGGIVFKLPPANETGVGTSFYFRNIGANNFIVNNNAGNLIQTVTVQDGDPNVFYFVVTDNLTAAGVWDSWVFGAGESSADADALAGYGLVALPDPPGVDRLNTIYDIQTRTNNFIISATDMSSYILCNNAVAIGVIDGLTSGFFFCAYNNSSADELVEIVPTGVLINGSSSNIFLYPGNSMLLTTDGTNWFTLGNNPSNPTPANEVEFPLNISSNTYTLPAATLNNNNIIIFTGTTAAACTVSMDSTEGTWTFHNLASGSNDVTVQLAGGATPITLIPNETVQIYCNTFTNQLFQVPNIGGSGLVPISDGGTGQSTATTAFNALSPLTTAGDLLYYNGTNNVRLGIPSSPNVGAALVATPDTPTPNWGGFGLLNISTNFDQTRNTFTTGAAPGTDFLPTALEKAITNSYMQIEGVICVGPSDATGPNEVLTVSLVRELPAPATTIAIFGWVVGYDGDADDMVTLNFNYVDKTSIPIGTEVSYHINITGNIGGGTAGYNRSTSGVTPSGVTSCLIIKEIGNAGAWG